LDFTVNKVDVVLLPKTRCCADILSLLSIKQGGDTQALAVGRSATVVKLEVDGQGHEICLHLVKGQDENEGSNPQLKSLCI